MKALLNLQGLKLKVVFAILVLIFFIPDGFTQAYNHDTVQGSIVTPYIKWVSLWPSTGKKNNTNGFRNIFNKIFLGKRTPVLSKPVSILAYDPQLFWILDQASNSIFYVEKDVGDIPHFISNSDFDFSSLVGICSLPDKNLLITDSHAQKIYKILPGEKQIQLLNDTLVLNQPTGIAYSTVKDEIWVAETSAHRVAVLNDKGELLKRVGRRGTAPGEFNFPTHIWIDQAGNVYIVDAMNFRVQVLNKDGEIISVFGEAGDATGYLSRPKGIAIDSYGHIYIVDALFHVVQVFDIQGNFLYKFGNQGQGEGEFWLPSGIYIDDQNYIYVADSYNSRIQVFQLIYGEQK